MTWSDVDWAATEAVVRRIQDRIFRAAKIKRPRLEPDDEQSSCPVLRGLGSGNGARLPDALSGRDRAQPGVKAADTCADDPARRGDVMVGPLGCHKGELGHAIPRAKKAAAFLRISTSSSSRLTSRRSHWVSACSALRAANASAEPAASCSLRHWLSCPGLTSSSVAISASG